MKIKTIIICGLLTLGLAACDDKKESPIIAQKDCLDKFIKEIDGWNYTDLGTAIHDGDLSRVKKLIKNGACVTLSIADEESGYDALFAAIISDRLEIIKYLIDSGIDVNRQYDEDGSGALSIACSTEDPDADPDIAYNMAKMLLDAGANVNGLDRAKYDLHTYPIYNAARSGNVKLTKLLIDRGADITMDNTKTILTDKVSPEINKLLLSTIENENNKIDANWFGKYSGFYSEDYQDIRVDYMIEISKGRCIFSAHGYQTSYEDLCLMRKNKDGLEIIYIKSNIEGNITNHENVSTMATIVYRGGKYYLTGPVLGEISEIPLDKK